MIYKPFQSHLLDVRLRLFILVYTNIYFAFFLDLYAGVFVDTTPIINLHSLGMPLPRPKYP